MFARKVSMHLKNDGAQAFKEKIENELFLVRQAEGILDEITFLYTSEKESHASVLCGDCRNTQRHTTVERIRLTKILASVVEGTPGCRRTKSSINDFKDIGCCSGLKRQAFLFSEGAG